MYDILNKIDNTKDLKKLNIKEKDPTLLTLSLNSSNPDKTFGLNNSSIHIFCITL